MHKQTLKAWMVLQSCYSSSLGFPNTIEGSYIRKELSCINQQTAWMVFQSCYSSLLGFPNTIAGSYIRKELLCINQH